MLVEREYSEVGVGTSNDKDKEQQAHLLELSDPQVVPLELLLECRVLLIGDVLLLVAYLWGLYIFRFKSPEHLATLMETVSFVCIDKQISAESVVVVVVDMSLDRSVKTYH